MVCESDLMPAGITCESGWVVYKVQSPLDFGLTEILSSIASPLSNKKISIFAISSYDTDFILVKEVSRDKSLQTLTKAGFQVVEM